MLLHTHSCAWTGIKCGWLRGASVLVEQKRNPCRLEQKSYLIYALAENRNAICNKPLFSLSHIMIQGKILTGYRGSKFSPMEPAPLASRLRSLQYCAPKCPKLRRISESAPPRAHLQPLLLIRTAPKIQTFSAVTHPLRLPLRTPDPAPPVEREKFDATRKTLVLVV